MVLLILGMKFVVADWCGFAQLQGGGHEGLPKAIGDGLVCHQQTGERGKRGLPGEGQRL